MHPTIQLECVSLSDICSRDGIIEASVRRSISLAFGPSGPGIIVVSSLPSSYFDLRKQLLDSGNALPFIPEEDLKALELPSIHYAVGWSHGREQFNGAPDYSKGSFYANPHYNDPSLGNHELLEKYPYVCFASRSYFNEREYLR